ncbi:transposase, partial [Nostoc sp. HG1]|nr:transposase [Nostoc sp. HG1]
EEDIKTDIYQATLLHKEFAQALNIVILVKINLKTNACSHVILFSSDLDLSYEKIIDYYKLRFQIEFNFRDAKQFWGLEDFMNLSQTAVTNAANLAFFMVNLSHHLLSNFRLLNPDSGIIDLKAYYRGFRYVREMLKMLPEIPEPIL